jgi:alkanesulfonate monooxygenase SsuD/methylene tetrahydromethanopterin reductase-like flavin-dependent oxidoreductase (luciferase family)
MEYGAHLPLIDSGAGLPTLDDLRAYARLADELGYRWLCANDHLLFARPWLDGPAALAAAVAESGDMTLATTVLLPVIRGPVQSAKLLAALDHLSGKRVVAGVGPGSSARDYEAAGVPFDERWPRFEATLGELRERLPDGPPLWVASWGSPAGLRRVERHGDGWIASGYNTTPERFATCRAALPAGLPNAVATMWLHVTERRSEADAMLTDVLAPMLNRSPEALRELSLPIGSAADCAERVAAFDAAGAERVLVWPLADELRQLERFREAIDAT